MPLRVLSAADIRAAAGMPEAIEAMRLAFGELSAGRARVPLRLRLPSAEGVTFVMPGYLEEGALLGAKLVSLFEGNRERGLPAIQGLVVLLDGRTGAPRAVMDGAGLTALRTGAASGLAAELLADEDASVLALFGAGVQARTQLEAIGTVRPVREVRIVSRTRASAERLAAEVGAAGSAGGPGPAAWALEDPREALRGAGLVVAATSSAAPVFDGADVEPGALVCSIGAHAPGMREVDDTTVRRARVVVDTREGALAEAGDLVGPVRGGALDPETVVELGEVVNGTAPGGRAGREIALFKSVGTAAQDIALAGRIAARAEARGLGTVVEM